MHTVERFALSAGAKINKPYIYDKFFPVTVDKYITFEAGKQNESKTYDHWPEVIELISPTLERLDIKIIQVGSGEDLPLDGCVNLNGSPSHGQAAYIIKKGLFHFGVDSFYSQVASHYDKKVLSLISTTLTQHSKPYWSEDDNYSCISPDFPDGRKPAYSNNEFPKSVNLIKPENVARQILDLLGEKLDFNYESQFIGSQYGSVYVDIIPNTTPLEYNSSFGTARIRMDLEYDEKILLDNLNLAQNAIIITNQPFSLKMINDFKSKISNIIFIFDEETANEKDFIEGLISMGIKTNFVTYQGKDKADELKLRYMEHMLVQNQKHLSKETIEDSIDDIDKLYFKSSKRVLSKGKIYSSYYHYKNDIPSESFDRTIEPVKDDPDFWRDLNHFNLLKSLD